MSFSQHHAQKYLVYMRPIIWWKIGDIVVLNGVLCGLNTECNSFHNFFGEFLIDLGFTPFREDQYLWLSKSEKYDGYEYIATRVDDIIIAENNPSRYMN